MLFVVKYRGRSEVLMHGKKFINLVYIVIVLNLGRTSCVRLPTTSFPRFYIFQSYQAYQRMILWNRWKLLNESITFWSEEGIVGTSQRFAANAGYFCSLVGVFDFDISGFIEDLVVGEEFVVEVVGVFFYS